MLRNRFIKMGVSTVLVLLALWVATPKVYIHHLLHHDHSALQMSKESKLQAQPTDDCDFHEYNKPVYFNIFKFISSFIPLKPRNEISKAEKSISISTVFRAAFFLRGPPVTE